MAAAAIALVARSSSAQPIAQTGATGSLERFQPSVPGDALFGVPSPAIGGHLVPRATVTLDYAYQPLSIEDRPPAGQGDPTRYVIVSDQLFLHAGASLALFDRVLISADMPFAIAQGGDSPTVADVSFASPSEAQVGDLRLGARLRLFGEFWDPFQLGVGGYLHVPTAPASSYAGDGAVRGEPHLLLGGRFEHFVYSASLGTTLRASTRPHTFDARAGAAVVLGDALFQIGPELSLSAPLSEDVIAQTPDTKITVATPVAAELLLGAKLRVLRSLVFGIGAGPGLSQGRGTPIFTGVGSIGYEPLPPRPTAADSDGDGILDPVDACAKVPGVRNDDPKKNGCPLDSDGDRILDADDACVNVPGVRSDDPKKNGCPDDGDRDGILDVVDACPTVPGIASDDPARNGCPRDTDGDGVVDPDDACLTVFGAKNADPKKNGCPPDRDDDGVPDAQDACPDERGGPDPDPKKNGCSHVTVTKTEIVITRQVQFRFAQSTLDQTVDPVSDDLLTEVRDAIVNHPEIQVIEVQGHSDTIGPEAYNQTLSDARAMAVRNWLVRKGIPSAKLVTKGFGSKAPIASNDTEDGRRENRRVQFAIVKKTP